MIRFALVLVILVRGVVAAEQPGFVSLFNGRDLEGWINVNCAPETWSVRDGVIHCTGKPTGALRTPRQYENFVIELEWRHLSHGGNSGIFIWSTPLAAPGVPFLRSVEVQVLENGYGASGKGQWYTTHGDVFPIHGSTMTPFGRHNGMRSFPSQERSKPSPEWNSYRIVCTNGVIRLSVNGVEVSGGENCNYRKGYFGLESEGAPVEFRNIRLQEFAPSSHLDADLVAPVDQGWRSLFTGLDLRGWATNDSTAAGWGVRGELMFCQPPPSQRSILWSAQDFKDAEWVVDVRPVKESETAARAALVVGSRGESPVELALGGAEPGKFQRYVLTVRGDKALLSAEGKTIASTTLRREAGNTCRFGVGAGGGTVEFMNLYARDL